jgi:uncharacterized membrane protein YkvA (DUF1232 family)
MSPNTEGRLRGGLVDRWRRVARELKSEIYALYLAYRDPRTPWYARLVAGLVVAYALSPVDLIPDPIPVLGHLDDLVVVPLGVILAVKLIPREVLTESRRRAALSPPFELGRWGLLIVVAAWGSILGVLLVLLGRLLGAG